MIPLGKYCDFNNILRISTFFLVLALCSSVTQTQSLETSPCTSADEFAAPTDGHCLPLKSCASIHSGSNTSKFRLILKALLCDQDDSSLENPKICCPDVKTNLIGPSTDFTQQADLYNINEKESSKEKEDEEKIENDSGDVTADEPSEFDYNDNNSSAIVFFARKNLVLTTSDMPNSEYSPDGIIAEGTKTTTEPAEDDNVEIRGEQEDEEKIENDSGDVVDDVSSEFDYKNNNSIPIVVLVSTDVVMTTKIPIPISGDSLEGIAEGTKTTTEPGEDADVESRGESQEDQVTTTTEGSENKESDFDDGNDGEITSETNAVTDTTDYDYKGKTMTIMDHTTSHIDYEVGFGPTLL